MIYFNNAATTYPKPEKVIDSVSRAIREVPSQQSRGFGPVTDITPDFCRKTASFFFRLSKPENIIFTSGATESLNTLIFGIVEPGYRVVTTVTEHNSVLRPLFLLEDEGKIELRMVGCDEQGYIDLDELADVLRGKTDLVIVNNVSNVTGAVQDIEKILDICGNQEIKIILDASQSAGHIPVSDYGYSNLAFVFTGHKGLFGIQGSGGFYIPSGIACRPLKVGGTGSRSESRRHSPELPVRFEAGTGGLPGIYSMAAGMKWVAKRGLDEISAHEVALRDTLVGNLSGIKGVRLFSAGKEGKYAGLLSFTIDNFSPDDVSFILEKSFGIITRPGLHCAPLIHKALGTFPSGTVRVSFSVFNTMDEVLQLIDAIKSIAGTVETV